MAKSAWTIGATFGVLLLLWAAVQFYVWAPTGLAPDSFVYGLKVPDAAKRAPLWNPQAEPTYDRRVSAGIAPDNTAIHYASRSPLSELERRARADGYRCQRLGDRTLTCDRSQRGAFESQVTARYEPQSGLSEVTVFVPD